MRAAAPSKASGKAAEVTTPAKRQRKARNVAFEAALGARIRVARIAADLTQTELGDAVGVSFQQIQKYELGRDRVSASTLLDIAAAVGVHPGLFYGGEMPAPAGGTPEVRAAWRLAERMRRIRNPALIAGITALVDELAGREGAAPAGFFHQR